MKNVSDLLETALLDLKLVEQQSEYYKVDMWDWFNYIDAKCHVCLAGAYLAKTCKAVFITEFRQAFTENEAVIFALDCFRRGQVSCAYAYLGIHLEENLDLKVTPYAVSKELWWRDMGRVLEECKKIDAELERNKKNDKKSNNNRTAGTKSNRTCETVS